MTAILQAYRQAYAGLPRRVWLLAGVMLVSRCGTMFLPFLSIYLTTESGYTPTQAGGVLAVYGVGSVVGTYAGGWLSHRFGPVRVIVVSLLLGAPGFVAIPLCSSLTMLVAALLYLSVVREASRPAINAAMSDFCPPEEHTRAFALNRLALNLGMSVGSGVSGVLATVGYGVMFGFNALVALLAAGLMLAAFGFAAARRGEQDAEATQAAATPWADGVFLAFLALQMLAALVFFQLIGALPMYWRSECGIQEWGIGVLFAVNTLLIVLLEMVVADLLRGVPP
ncbi:MAG: MFS transporter, partial [Planctomycetota bacterium]